MSRLIFIVFVVVFTGLFLLGNVVASEDKNRISQKKFNKFSEVHKKADEWVAESKLLAHEPGKRWVPPRNFSESEIDAGILRFQDSNFINSTSSNIVSSVFLIPNYWYAELRVKWTELLGRGGEKVAEMNDDFSPLADGVDIRKYVDSNNGTVSRQYFIRSDETEVSLAQGKGTVRSPSQVERYSFSCNEVNSTVKLGGAAFILRHCSNSMVAIERQGKTKYEIEIILTDSDGRLLSTASSLELPLFDGFKRLTDFSVDNPPEEIDGRLYYYLAKGIIAKINVVAPLKYVKREFPVTARPLLTNPSSDDAENPHNKRYAFHPKNIAPISLDATTLRSEVELSISKQSSGSSAGLTQLHVKVPEYFNSFYADVELKYAMLEDSDGVKYSVKNNLSGFDLLIEPENRSLNRLLFTRVSGELLIDYPVSMQDIRFPSDEEMNFNINFKGGHLTLSHPTSLKNDILDYLNKIEKSFARRDYEVERFPVEVFPLRVFDADGFAIEPERKISETMVDENTIYKFLYAGEISSVRLAIINRRASLSVPFSFDLPWGLPVEMLATVEGMDDKAYWKAITQTLMSWHIQNEINDLYLRGSDDSAYHFLKKEGGRILDMIEVGEDVESKLADLRKQSLTEVDFDSFLNALKYFEHDFPVKRHDDYKNLNQHDDYELLKREVATLLLNTPKGLPKLNEDLTANDLLLTFFALSSARFSPGYTEDIRQIRISYAGTSIYRDMLYGYQQDVISDDAAP